MSDTETFFVTVNYDDPRWKTINRDRYYALALDLTPEHFPIRGTGIANIIMTFLVFAHELTTREVFDEMEQRGLRRPDRAEVESFYEQHLARRQELPVIGFGGSIEDCGHIQFIACVDVGREGLGLNLYPLDFPWYRRCRFLAVKK